MSIVYFNGDFVDGTAPLIHHIDCGYTTGIGIFDSMLCIDGNFQYMKEHYERLIHDANTVTGITLRPLTHPSPHGERAMKLNEATRNLAVMGEGEKEFQQIIQTLLDKNNLRHGYARIRTTITGGIVNAPLAPAQNLTVLIDIASCAPPPESPVSCAIIIDFPRIAGCVLENCKRSDYTRSYAARRKAEALGATEAILTNTDGNIACGATSNLFIEENGTLTTPPLSDGVLAGVTRRKLIEERDVREESISVERLHNADKIFLTNSFIGLRNVTLIKQPKHQKQLLALP